MDQNFENVEYRHEFDEVEKAEIAKMLAAKNSEKFGLEEAKKSVNSDFKAKIDECNAHISLLSTQYNQGWTYKMIRAIKRKNYERTRWEWINPETFEIIKTNPFSAADYQTNFSE